MSRRCLLTLIGACLALVAAGAATAAPGVATERIERAVAFLETAQNSDGGFGEAGMRSDPTLSAWVALALDAAGVEAASLRRGATTLGAYLARQDPELATDIELQLMARAALGLNTDALAQALRAKMRPSGRIGPRLNSTIWGVLALRAAGEPAPKRAVRYLRRHQHKSGGFSFVAKGPPDTNDTAAAIQALRAAGFRARSKPIKRALRYLVRARKGTGGYSFVPRMSADAQSTGWVLQGYAAARRGPPTRAKRYLVRLQQTDGSFHYRKGQKLTPVWVTAQVLPGLLDAPFG